MQPVPPADPPPLPVPLLGTLIHPVTREEAAGLVCRLASRHESALVVTPNVDHVVLLHRDEALRRAYARATLRLCDGAPLLVLARLCGRRLPGRVTGADLMMDVCAVAAEQGLRVFVAGGAPDVLEQALANLRRDHPPLLVSGYSPAFGFEGTAEEAELVRRVKADEPAIVMVCLGAPRAEVWAAGRLSQQAAVYLCVGAAVDFAAGSRLRAPAWMQRLGIEWAFRLVQEPGRLWRRYLVQDAVFFPLAVRELIRSRLPRRQGQNPDDAGHST